MSDSDNDRRSRAVDCILREFYFFQGTYVVLKIKKVISLIPKVVYSHEKRVIF